MIYLDNSATTWPKPPQVQAAAAGALKNSANPGRSAHAMSRRAGESIYSARLTAARFFGMEDETRVIFTPGCTWSLNTAIRGVMSGGGHAVVSDMEHNAVMRPLEAMKSEGVSWTAAAVCPSDNDRTVDSFRRCIRADTKAIICTHASNVWGVSLPVERLCALAHAYGLVMIVDAAQSAGVLPLDMSDGYDIVCCAGHKGLYAPMGVGLMLLGEGVDIPPLITGGTGSNSASLAQPAELPDRFESGTPNLPGIAGLEAGIKFITAKGRQRILTHEMSLIRRAYKGLSSVKGVKLFTTEPDEEHFAPVLSFNAEGLDSEETAAALARSGIAVRAGLHCAPAAHAAIGTLETGAVRISVSAFSTARDIDMAVSAVKRLAKA